MHTLCTARLQKHRGAMKGWPEHLGPAMVFATEASKGVDTGETHAERLARLKRQADLDREEQEGGDAAGGAAADGEGGKGAGVLLRAVCGVGG